MNTNLKDRMMKGARVLALLLVCAGFAAHSPAAKAQGYQAGNDAFFDNNWDYVFDGAQWWPTGLYRIMDANSTSSWWQYNYYQPTQPGNHVIMSQGWAYVTLPGFNVAVPFRNSYVNLLDVEETSFFVWVNGGYKSLAQWKSEIAAMQAAAGSYTWVGGQTDDPMSYANFMAAACETLRVSTGGWCVQRTN